jgi:hypothetical protein
VSHWEIERLLIDARNGVEALADAIDGLYSANVRLKIERDELAAKVADLEAKAKDGEA